MDDYYIYNYQYIYIIDGYKMFFWISNIGINILNKTTKESGTLNAREAFEYLRLSYQKSNGYNNLIARPIFFFRANIYEINDSNRKMPDYPSLWNVNNEDKVVTSSFLNKW
jgi:hypothetical protein